MSIEGVMVSYNYSEDDEVANILTVSASGIIFSKRWVLTHGSVLSPLKLAKIIKNSKGKPILNDQFYDNLPEIYVTCDKKPENGVLGELERLSKERNQMTADLEHSSYHVRVLTGRICHVWQCPVLDRCVDDILFSWTIGHRDGDVEQQTQLGKALLSVFVLIDLESASRGPTPLRPLSELFDVVKRPPGRGSNIQVHSTPFGNEVFLNSVTRGAVCGVVGRRPALLLTDAATSLGSEGGPVFAERDTNELMGMVVCSVSWWRGEWVGLTLVAPLLTVLSEKLSLPTNKPPTTQSMPSTYSNILERIDGSTVVVRCGAAWGAGVYLGLGHVLTCAHVVRNHTSHKVTVYCQGVRETAIVRYATREGRAYDVALLYVDPQYWTHLSPAEFADEPPEKGEPVLAAGYPYFNENHVEELRPMVTSGHINNVSPSMIQTSCCIQSGFSGGPVLRVTAARRVQVLALIVSNAKTHAGATYPYVNMAVPARAFLSLLREYIADRDKNKMTSIGDVNEMIQMQWRLLPYRSKI